jgi:uncharacterized protein YegP (UPF0339 family)
MVSYFLMSTDSKGEWRWMFRAGNDETIAVSSEGYKNKADCQHSINLVKKDAPSAVVIEA